VTDLRTPRLLLTSILAAGSCLTCGPDRHEALSAAESAYLDLRELKDRIDVTRARGARATPQGVELSDLLARYRAARGHVRSALPSEAGAGLGSEDRRALEVMRRALEKDFGEENEPPAAAPAGEPENPDCAYDAASLAQGQDGLRALGDRMYACFGRAAHHLPFEGRTLDRLTVFSLLPVTRDGARRRRIFFALEPVWRAINRDDGPGSPYRRLVRLSAEGLAADGSSVEAGARSLGIEPRVVEEWLTSVLERWRTIAPEREIEPWDFAYESGKASRDLAPAITLETLRPVNRRFYTDLGADPAAIGIQYDLEPRDGKDPVAFTTFGARPRNGGRVNGEPWVFASYTIGSVDNLNELLHESGHAVHIAAIRARPAFADWPDSDLFTEAIADIAALEMFEPVWQRKYLGTSVPLADSMRSKYAGIVMDTAWALFEIRMHREPDADPNLIWTEITRRYLRIRPHPELSWWAVRGQLVNLPGYMLNYALGAILVADLRGRAQELHGPWSEGDPTWYPWVSDRLYRFGLARPSRQVIEDFLGRSISPKALLDDMSRGRESSRRAGRAYTPDGTKSVSFNFKQKDDREDGHGSRPGQAQPVHGESAR